MKNSNYRSILFDLLSPFIEESTSETASGHLAEDPQSEKESRTIVHKLSNRQGGGTDPSPSIAKKGALKTAL